MHQQPTALENIVGEGKTACNEHFLLFPQYFLLNQIIVSPIVHIFDIISLFDAELEKPKINKLILVNTDEDIISMRSRQCKIKIRLHILCSLIMTSLFIVKTLTGKRKINQLPNNPKF